MTRSARKVLLLLGACLVLAAVALPKLGAFRGNSRPVVAEGTPREQRLTARMLMVHSEMLGDRVVVAGTILPNEEVEIRSEISGKIDRIFFIEGRQAGKGDMLMKIDDAELQAQLLRAQYRVVQAEQQEQRQRQLFEKQLASQEEYDNAVSSLNILKAELQLIKTQISKTEIRAPFAGVIGLRFVSEGSYISPATRITTLQDNSVVKIDFKVPEKYAAAIKTGHRFKFTVPAVAGTFTGTIYARDTQIDPATRTLRLLARSTNPEGVLLPGAFADVEVVLQDREALMIPAQALIPELKGHRVFVHQDGRAVPRSVEIGVRTDTRVEITSGLQAGDTLITSAILQLRPGMAVQPAQSQ